MIGAGRSSRSSFQQRVPGVTRMDLCSAISAGVVALILRDSRESPAKCSLTAVRDRADLEFVRFRVEERYRAAGLTLLHCDGEPLGPADRDRPLLLLDSSWRRSEVILRRLDGVEFTRCIPPGFATAYPRRSRDYEDPAAGLASIEALYAAIGILRGRDDSLLAGYRWREEFLRLNARPIARILGAPRP
jgi:pre-rRNA-processing protein TSR3